MGVNAARPVLETPTSVSASPPVAARQRVEMTLHPIDLANATAIRNFVEMEHDEFYGLVLHLGTQALLATRGLKLGSDGRVSRLNAGHP
ncbi:hypothetical protein [Paraburkholderia sp. A3RO-2L]|uniref:hypothetical protein n=1 Tax=Paraburkholderia sp. A3RO-2L TaxID=3028376 RepID=UPI003DA7B99D